MKTLIYFFTALLFAPTMFSQTMIIHKNDHTTVEVQFSQVDSITFSLQPDTTTPGELSPPSNLTALSLNSAVRLFWKHSLSSSDADFAGYVIMTSNGSVNIDSIVVSKDSTEYIIPGLTNGQEYTFSVRSLRDDGNVSAPVVIEWGPTIRYASVRIYEFESSNAGAIQLSTATPFTFSSVSPDNRSFVDLWVDGRSNADLLLKSPSDENFPSVGWRQTKLYATSATSLNQPVTIPYESSFQTAPGLAIVANRVYLAITNDGNYVRFQVSAVGGTAPNRYLDITIAYNQGNGDWAKR